MTDDELDRALRAARPSTPADDQWAAGEDGDRMLEAIRRRAAVGEPGATAAGPGATAAGGPGSSASGGRLGASRRRLRHARPIALGAGLAAAAAAIVAVSLTTPDSATSGRTAAAPPPATGSRSAVPGPAPQDMALVAYDDCSAMLHGLRAHAAAQATAYGLAEPYPTDAIAADSGLAAPSEPTAAAGSAAAAPDHSTTNDQEIGVGEPDIVETDGRRVVSVSGGVLRVIDAATRKVTGTLDLTMYAGADSAQLLMSGDRVLVLLGTTGPSLQRVPYSTNVSYASPAAATSTFLLVDVAGAPRTIGTLHPKGGFVDARMVDGTARLVVSSAPRLAFPTLTGKHTLAQRVAAVRGVIQRAPLSAWLPAYDTSDGLTTATHTVPCGAVRHPDSYTGASLLTVYSIELAGSVGDVHPVTVAADGATVYASPTSLYVASTVDPPGPRPLTTTPVTDTAARTQLHRFDISRSGAPTYLGSGTVPGRLMDAYSMSDYAGSLRVVTTTDRSRAAQSSAVYVLDADTLKITGHVGGLGRGEQVHAVRFVGPLAYVVTYESVDPLYVLDLHDPTKPRTAGELTITGYSDYLHPVGSGRLLGVGEDVNAAQIVTGLQVSLFDVSRPGLPRRVDRIVRKHTPSETPIDPHAFLYWPAARLAVLPIDSWTSDESGAALVVRVGDDDLTTVGTIRNPAVSSTPGYVTGIERTLVIGEDIWTMSSSGLQVSNLHSLARRAWVPFP